MDVEIREFTEVEIEICGPIVIRIIEICACPVKHGHEIVADSGYAGLTEITERLFVVLDERVAVLTAILD